MSCGKIISFSDDVWKGQSTAYLAHRAFMGFFPCMPADVDHQHVLGLKRLLFSAAALPLAHKGLLVALPHVFQVQVLQTYKFK